MTAKVTAAKRAPARRAPVNGAPGNGHTTARPSPAERPGILAMPGFEPLRLSTTDPEPLDDRRIEMFWIDDTVYTIPAEMPMSWALEYMHVVSTGSGQMKALATDWLLTAALGEEAYAALRGYPHLRGKHFTWVMEQITSRALGAVEEAVPKAPGSA